MDGESGEQKVGLRLMLSDSASTMSFGKLTIPGIDGAGCK